MTVTLSSKGQVVLPKGTRLRLQLRPGHVFLAKASKWYVSVIPTAQEALDALKSSSKV